MSWLIDLIMGFIGIGMDAATGRRYGFAFVIWRVVAGLCLLLGIVFTVLEWYVFSVIAFVGVVVCVICESLQLRADIRSKREEQKRETE